MFKFWIRYDQEGGNVTILRFVTKDEWKGSLAQLFEALRHVSMDKEAEMDEEGGLLSISWIGVETGLRKTATWGTY